MNFYESFLKQCNRINRSPSRVALDIGLSKTSVNKWKHGGLPKDATLQKLADYFQVDIQTLLGDVPVKEFMERKEPAIEIAEEINEEISIDRLAKCADIVTMLSTTSDENIDLVLALVKKITGEQ